jgi:outer membrane PBP1 activator LpoA protein
MGEDKRPCPAISSENIMESGGKQMKRRGTGRAYRIVVRSELSRRYASAFEGMEMETKGGQTVLTGEVIDQPHLHGILDRISSLGLELVSVESMYER